MNQVQVIAIFIFASLTRPLLAQPCSHISREINPTKIVFTVSNETGLVSNITLAKDQGNLSIGIVYYPYKIFTKIDKCKFDDEASVLPSLTEEKRCTSDLGDLANFTIKFVTDEQLNLSAHCHSHSISLNESKLEGRIPYILPNQAYLFAFFDRRCPGLMSNLELPTVYCTPPDRPRFQPRTDPSSFRIYTAPTGISTKRRADLYWNPVPHILRSSDDFHYHIKCCSHPNSDNLPCIEKNVEADIGLAEVDSGLEDDEYSCSIRSENELGHSEGSHIIIPAQKNYLYIPNLLTLYILAWPVGTQLEATYRMRWPRVDQNQNSKSTGTYTIYRCTSFASSDASKCTSIEILHKSPTSSENRFIVNRALDGKFGISFRNETHSTGINWAAPPCIMNQELLSDLKALTILGSSLHNKTAVTLKFALLDCTPIITQIEKFELIYCAAGSAKVCADTVLLNKGLAKTQTEQDWTGNKDCTTTNITNNLSLDIIWNGLKLSNRYEFRLRYQIGSIKSRWSDAMVIDFADHRSTPWFCRNFHIAIPLVIILVLLVTVVVIKTLAQKCATLFLICKEAEANVPERFRSKDQPDEETWSEIGLKYWLQSDPDQSSVRRSSTDIDSSGHGSNIKDDHQDTPSDKTGKQVARSFSSLSDDYVQLPTHSDTPELEGSDRMVDLNIGHQEDNHQDDTSVSSYSSSFLNHILDANN